MTTFEQLDNYPDLKKRASALAAKYGLREGTGTSLDYFWLGRDFAIVFLLDRDGADVRYIDLSSPAESEMYFLGHFLTAHRGTVEINYPAPPQTLKPSVLISVQLEYLLKLLDRSADILRGDRTWLAREYQLERARTPQSWRVDVANFQAKLTS
jgi:hypothetical protein